MFKWNMWAQEMKNLVAEIKTGHRDRRTQISAIKRETRSILKAADDYMKRVGVELKEMAKELKDFLAKGEETRKRDFNAMMGEIQAKIKEIKRETKDFLAKSEEGRIADFKAMMKEVTETVRGIEREMKRILNNYSAERKEAASHWASLRSRRASSSPKEEEEEEEE